MLTDNRFVQHFKFPRPLGEGQGEGLVSATILKDVAEFGRRTVLNALSFQVVDYLYNILTPPKTKKVLHAFSHPE